MIKLKSVDVLQTTNLTHLPKNTSDEIFLSFLLFCLRLHLDITLNILRRSHSLELDGDGRLVIDHLMK